jgi:hypothetical protein
MLHGLSSREVKRRQRLSASADKERQGRGGSCGTNARARRAGEAGKGGTAAAWAVVTRVRNEVASGCSKLQTLAFLISHFLLGWLLGLKSGLKFFGISSPEIPQLNSEIF